MKFLLRPFLFLPFISAAFAAAPVNDNHANFITVGPALPVNVAGTNVDATDEIGEYRPGNFSSTVWYRWTSPVTGYVDISTAGAGFDTLVAAYSVTPGVPGVSSLLGFDDDDGSELTSRLTLVVTAGQAIAIQVAGYEGAEGTFPLTITGLPTPHDSYASRRVLASSAGVNATVSNAGATLEPGEPVFLPSLEASVWFVWTAPSTGLRRVETLGGGELDTVLAVYNDNGTLPVLGALVGQNNDAGVGFVGSEVVFLANEGQTYAFQVGSSGAVRGSFKLTVDVPRPANDFYRNRVVLGNAADVTQAGNNVGASLEAGEHSVVNNEQATIWYEWTAPASDYVQFDTLTLPGFDTVLGVYNASPGNAPPLAAALRGSNDDLSPSVTRSRVIINAVAGQTYAIQVGGFANARGAFTLKIAPALPPNNDYANRTALASERTVSISGFNVRGTIEAGESLPTVDMEATVWYVWKAPLSGSCSIDTTGPAIIDTILAVYDETGALPLPAARLAWNDDGVGLGLASKVTFNVVAGNSYVIQIGGYKTARGTFPLNLVLSPVPAEIAIAVPGTPDLANGGIYSAITAEGQPLTLTVTVRNVGGLDLTGLTTSLQGPDAAHFVVSQPLPPAIGGLTSASCKVTFTPTAADTRSATLRILSNDADESLFDVVLSCRTLSSSVDTDEDGLNDAAEFRLAALGFDWQLEQFDLVATLLGNANAAGLFSQGQLQAMHVGMQAAVRNPSTGRFTLRFDLKKSADLIDFDNFSFVPAGVTVAPGGHLLFEFDAPDDAAFFRLDVE